jgi:hypothetical protein
MVQALAFAEIFLGLILADAGYKGVSLSAVVKGEAGSSVAPAPLGSSASSSTAGGSTGGSGSSEVPGGKAAPSPFSVGGSIGNTLPTLAPGLSSGGPGAFNWPAGTVKEADEALAKEPGGIFVPKATAK